MSPNQKKKQLGLSLSSYLRENKIKNVNLGGTYKGKKQPAGAYIWIIKGLDRNGKTVEMKGTVMLVQ